MYKVAIIGCENSHATHFMRHVLTNKAITDMEFVGVYSYDRAAAEKLNEEFGVYVADSYDEFVGKVDGIVINPGAYTHTSIAILDALKSIAPIPAVEIHLSDILQRESFRHISYPAMACIGQIKGKGAQGYLEAIDLLIEYIQSNCAE